MHVTCLNPVESTDYHGQHNETGALVQWAPTQPSMTIVISRKVISGGPSLPNVARWSDAMEIT